ncbi:MAG: PAS domain-containing sensor histidine kinase [Persicimonas sp.]
MDDELTTPSAPPRDRRLQATFDNAAVGIAHLDLEGHWIAFNDRLRQMLGYERDELHELTYRDITHPDDLDASEETAEALLSGKISSAEVEKRYIRKDGSVLWARVTASIARDDRGDPAFFVSILQDITEYRQLREAQALLAAIVWSSDDAIISKRLDGTIRSWNRGAERIFGYTADEAIGESIKLIIPPHLWDEESAILKKLASGERIEHYETERVAKDGRHIDISLTISPIYDVSGEIIGASKVARNITERKRAQRALEEANARKDEYLAMLGHELRNPLAAIRSSGELIQEANVDNPVIEKGAAILHRQTSHMERLIDGLLDVSRLSRGKIALERRPIDLVDIVEDVLAACRKEAESKRIDLQVELGAESLPLSGDPTRLTQVLGNLVDNALKFTPAGGRIVVRGDQQGDQIELAVEDDGEGFEPEIGPRLFEAFQQGAQDPARSQGGLGLGLSLCKGLVELHGGTIEAHSDGPGEGARFSIKIPRADADAGDALD